MPLPTSVKYLSIEAFRNQVDLQEEMNKSPS